MEYPTSPLTWTYFCQGKNIEELRQNLFCASLELETTRLAAQEEIKKREDQVIHLKCLLKKTISERDEAQQKCVKHLMDKLILQQLLQQADSCSDCEESVVVDPFTPPPMARLLENRPLPEKGKLVQAVLKAGPLLETLLLAGQPLPQWRHPPPPLEMFEIPPVIIPSPPVQLVDPDSASPGNDRKRSWMAYEGSDSSTNSKYQRVLLQQ